MIPQFVVEVLAGAVFAAYVAHALGIDPVIVIALAGAAFATELA